MDKKLTENLTDKQLVALEVLSNPDNAQLTVAQKAKLSHCSVPTLYKWKKDKDFNNALKELQQAKLMAFRPMADHALMKMIQDGTNVQALTLFYKLIGLLREVESAPPIAQRIEINVVNVDTKKATDALDVKVEFMD